jgi:Leucine-rich repeat (LRR) protein/Tfp pilus assembly protein PilF
MKTNQAISLFKQVSLKFSLILFLALLLPFKSIYSQGKIVDTASYSRMPEFDLKESSAYSSSEIFKLRVRSEDLKEFLGLVDLLDEVKQLKLVIDKDQIGLSDLFVSLERMKSLEVLTLTVNIPGPIPAELGDMKSLKELYISGKKITSLPPEIGNLENLETLGLDEMKITTVPAEVNKLKKLKSLYIYGISSLDLSPFSGCAQINELHLHANNLAKLPDAVMQMKNLKRFCSEGNPGIDYAQALSSLSVLPDLSFVQLKSNKLKALPATVSQLKSLSILDLSSNEFTQIPAELLVLENLNQLFIKDNQLSVLPDEFSQLKKLKALDLSGNKFTTLPAVVAKMPMLTSLTMDRNNITDPGPDAAKMQQLQVLSLLDNKKLDLTSLLASLSQLPNLQDLSLGGYGTSALPADIGKIKNLKSLEISLGLKSLPSELFSLVSLEELYLNDNKLESVPDAILNLKNLRILDLSGNTIHDFPKMLIKLPNLEDLVLCDNGMNTPTDYGQEAGADHVAGFRHLKYLDISGNGKLIIDDVQNLINDLPAFQMCISDVYMEYRSEAERAYKQGNDRIAQKDFAGASKAFSKAIELNPMMAEAYSGRGQIRYAQTHDNAGAMDDFNHAIDADSSRSDFFKYRGDVNASMNNFKSAVTDYTKAISLNGNDEHSYLSRGAIKFRQMKDAKGGIDDITKAIIINPKDGSYFTARARIKYDSGEKNAACEDWKKAADLGDKDGQDLLKKFCK